MSGSDPLGNLVLNSICSLSVMISDYNLIWGISAKFGNVMGLLAMFDGEHYWYFLEINSE